MYDILSDPVLLSILECIAECIGLSLLLACNILGLFGIFQSKANLLLPWLVVTYLIGFVCFCFVSLWIIITQRMIDVSILEMFASLCLGIVFFICWTLVWTTFHLMRKEMFYQR